MCPKVLNPIENYSCRLSYKMRDKLLDPIESCQCGKIKLKDGRILNVPILMFGLFEVDDVWMKETAC